MNRRMILELVDNEWARWQRYGKRFSVLVLDADNFKSVNDRYGHLAGDQALKFLAARISEAVRAVDIVGRYGGEEFIIILPETSNEGAVMAGEKILQNIRKAPLTYDGHVLNLTASVGAASVRTEDRNEEILLNRADLALLDAKKAGKDRVVAAPL
jgi:diguanylate cyclase